MNRYVYASAPVCGSSAVSSTLTKSDDNQPCVCVCVRQASPQTAMKLSAVCVKYPHKEL